MNNIKKNNGFKERKERSLYLSDFYEKMKELFTERNLILSPVGSGKTQLILRKLHKKGELSLLCVSTTSLKESVSKELEVYTTKDIAGWKNKEVEGLVVITYAELGKRLLWSESFLDKFNKIYADEIHSLFDYFLSFGKKNELYNLIKLFFYRKENKKQIFMFTATRHKIDLFLEKNVGVKLEDVGISIFDYKTEEKIMSYKATYTTTFTDGNDIGFFDEAKGLKKEGKKIVIFTEKIKEMNRTVEVLKAQGFRAISIWSVNNEENPMTKEQLRVRDKAINENVIDENYDVLVINGAMREGWELKDEDIECVIVNSLDETNIIQARGRVRKDILFFFHRELGVKYSLDLRILRRIEGSGLLKSYSGRPLDTAEKEHFCKLLNIRREENGTLVKWAGIKKALIEGGYILNNERVINEEGSRILVTEIVMKEETTKQ